MDFLEDLGLFSFIENWLFEKYEKERPALVKILIQEMTPFIDNLRGLLNDYKTLFNKESINIKRGSLIDLSNELNIGKITKKLQAENNKQMISNIPPL